MDMIKVEELKSAAIITDQLDLLCCARQFLDLSMAVTNFTNSLTKIKYRKLRRLKADLDFFTQKKNPFKVCYLK